ncbi:MAG: GntR family transcriptional regulator [Anaerolineae bacterium]|nr:GntR family transcriptional regulator [Anaerolineae bacterium]
MSDQVYETLRTAIICLEIAPGEKLVELEIAAQMGTSQGPVREALQRLVHDGLVERRARSATVVTRLSTDEMYELFSVRGVIEGFAIRRTAEKITPEQCDSLVELVEKMAQFGQQKEMIPLAGHDMQFHRQIVEWSGSAGLLRVWNTLSSQMERFIIQSHVDVYIDFVEIGTRHYPIVEALRRHDADAAARAVQEHIMLIWSEILP